MYDYTAPQWLLFFFSYCFLGWVWESCFVSLRTRTWTNRGFLYGPWIPIYGFGAVIILWLTLPVRQSIPLIYLLGMTGATVLEYVTGAAMEKIFHVRYWDYSNAPLNLNGHICLFCSLGWGVFSVLLVKYLHPPVEQLILLLPATAAEILSMALLAAFAVDATRSVQEALHLKELLGQLAESNAAIAKIQSRLDEAADALAKNSAQLRERLQGLEALLQEPLPAVRGRGRKALETALGEARRRRQALLRQLSEKADLLMESGQKAAESLPDLPSFRERLRQMEASLSARRDRELRRAADLLRRNPSAVSPRYRREVESLRRILGRRKKKGREKTED